MPFPLRHRTSSAGAVDMDDDDLSVSCLVAFQQHGTDSGIHSAYWMSDLVNAGSWSQVSSFVSLGLTWWESMLAGTSSRL